MKRINLIKMLFPAIPSTLVILAGFILTNSIFSRDYILKKCRTQDEAIEYKIKTNQAKIKTRPHASYGPAV